MAKKFFPEEWEKLSKEELSNSRARLSGFIESTTEKEKTIRDVSFILGVSNIILFCLMILLEKVKNKYVKCKVVFDPISSRKLFCNLKYEVFDQING